MGFRVEGTPDSCRGGRIDCCLAGNTDCRRAGSTCNTQWHRSNVNSYYCRHAENVRTVTSLEDRANVKTSTNMFIAVHKKDT